MLLRIQSLTVVLLLAISGSPLTHAGSSRPAPAPAPAQPELASLQVPEVAPTHWTQAMGAAITPPGLTGESKPAVARGWAPVALFSLAFFSFLFRWIGLVRRQNRVSLRREQNVLWSPRRK